MIDSCQASLSIVNNQEGERRLNPQVSSSWAGSVVHSEFTLHQLSPYIGKMKSSMAKALLDLFTLPGETVFDPFCGSGTLALEAWTSGRNIIARDLSPYAAVLTRAKLNPPGSLQEALALVDAAADLIRQYTSEVDLRRVPRWVRAFFHPRTLKETIAWVTVLRDMGSDYLLACLLGILHHQRPGFLSYPSSHAVPYLRNHKFPAANYPEMYAYREVKLRLVKKVKRSLKRLPEAREGLTKTCDIVDGTNCADLPSLDAIITSPPYMRQLDYARDNRLRLWFLGVNGVVELDRSISPSEQEFLALMTRALESWQEVLKPRGMCILVVGNDFVRVEKAPLPDALVHIATKLVGGYKLVWRYSEDIPNDRRVRRGYSGSTSETVLVLSHTGKT